MSLSASNMEAENHSWCERGRDRKMVGRIRRVCVDSDLGPNWEIIHHQHNWMHLTGCNYIQSGPQCATRPTKATGNWPTICVFMGQNCIEIRMLTPHS